MARKHERIDKKITASGIEIVMLDNTIIKTYSRTMKVFMVFSNHQEANKEYKKHRKGYKKL